MRNGRSIPFLVVALCACGVAVGQPERIIYVDGAAVGANDGSSWADAYRYLQDALAEAAGVAPPVEIRVAQGVYKPDQGAGVMPGDRDASFRLLNGITWKGGYAGTTAADPDVRDVEGYTTVLSGGPETRRVVTGDLTDASAVIDGFTITSAPLDEMSVFGMFTDGMYIDSGSPVVRNCTFHECDRGLNIRAGSPSLVGCRFSENVNGAFWAWDCNSVLTGCVFERHGIERHSFWEAVHCVPGNLKLKDCTFAENADGGIRVFGTLDLVRCSFVGNSETFRGVVDCSGPLTATDCVFLDNRGEGVSVHGDAELIGCRFLGNSSAAVDAWGDTLRARRCVFSRGTGRGAAIWSVATYMELSHCIFTGNHSASGGTVDSHGRLTRISQCTFAGNRGEPSTINAGYNVEMTQCIVRDGPDWCATWPPDVAPPVMVTYSNVEGGYAGEGNFDADPCFVDPGYWDANDTPDDPNDDVWVGGDYHLKSQAGHWDGESESWVFDDVTSPCIDAGDPNAPIDAEPFPNGGYANRRRHQRRLQGGRLRYGHPAVALADGRHRENQRSTDGHDCLAAGRSRVSPSGAHCPAVRDLRPGWPRHLSRLSSRTRSWLVSHPLRWSLRAPGQGRGRPRRGNGRPRNHDNAAPVEPGGQETRVRRYLLVRSVLMAWKGDVNATSVEETSRAGSFSPGGAAAFAAAR